MRMTKAHVCLVVTLVGACRGEQIVDGVNDSTFVATVAALRRVQTEPGLDSAGRTARRDSILQSRGLTPAALERAARMLAESPARAQRVWQAVERRTRQPAADSTTPARPGTSPR